MTGYCHCGACCIQLVCSVILTQSTCHLMSLTFDLDIQKLGVDTQSQVTWQCPGCRRPGNQSYVLTLNQREADDHRWILNILQTKYNKEMPYIQYCSFSLITTYIIDIFNHYNLIHCHYLIKPAELWEVSNFCQPCSSGETQSWRVGCCRQWRKAWLWHHGTPDPCHRAVWTPTCRREKKKVHRGQRQINWIKEDWSKDGFSLICYFMLLHISISI